MSSTDVPVSTFGPLLADYPSKLPAQTMASSLGNIISVPGFLSAAECAKLIDASEKAGYEKLSWNPVRVLHGDFSSSKGVLRNCK